MVHLLAITIGLLIAVGIEGCVEMYHEHSLVKEARRTLREEIQYNSDKMAGALPEIEKERASVADSIKFLTRIVEHPKDKAAQSGSIGANFAMVGLHDTAWKTAQATKQTAKTATAAKNEWSRLRWVNIYRSLGLAGRRLCSGPPRPERPSSSGVQASAIRTLWRRWGR